MDDSVREYWLLGIAEIGGSDVSSGARRLDSLRSNVALVRHYIDYLDEPPEIDERKEDVERVIRDIRQFGFEYATKNIGDNKKATEILSYITISKRHMTELAEAWK